MSQQDEEDRRELGKKGRRRQQREHRKEQERLRTRRQRRQKVALWLAAVLIVAGAVAVAFLPRDGSPATDPQIISTQGLHRHAELSISIQGQEQTIPANIGLTGGEQPIHTHDEDHVIHLEFTGLVRRDDIRLGRFFEIWGRTFNQTCIFDNCNGSEGQLSMFVNGEPNLEFENYIMQDRDAIRLVFE